MIKLGILVSCDKHISHVVGLVAAASQSGTDVSIFCMDTGIYLVQKPEFKNLCQLDGVTISLCRHSAERLGIDLLPLSKDIVCGSQFNNAIMNHESHRVIVL